MHGHGRTPTRIKVVGVGGGGGSALDRMRSAGLRGAELVAVNTDIQALHRCGAAVKMLIGRALTCGLGAGGDWTKGRDAAAGSLVELRQVVSGADLLFVVTGTGGGTGTGASAVIASAAKAEGALTVGVVTRPFRWEGKFRNRTADAGIAALREQVDALIVVRNDQLVEVVERRTTLEEAFGMADDVLRQGVQAIADLVAGPDAANQRFADVRGLLSKTGECRIGIGLGSGERAAADAARNALTCPLLGAPVDRARGILLNVTAGQDVSPRECEAAVALVRAAAPTAAIVSGIVTDAHMPGEARVSLVATGIPPLQGVDPEPLAPSGVPARPRPRLGSDGAFA